MRLINGDDSRNMDREAMDSYGLDTLVLMENAGLRAADYAATFTKAKGRVSVVAGKGNNGGDGFVVARHLFNKGYNVEVFCFGPVEAFSPGAKYNFDIVAALGIPVTFLDQARDLTLFRVKMMASDLIVDAIFGSGFRGEIEGLVGDVVNIINEAEKTVLALDIPSGVDADTGVVSKIAVKASRTVTFGLPKFGNVLGAGCENNGILEVVDISFPPCIMTEKETDSVYIDEKWVVSKLVPRKADSHKGLFGHILVCGGSANMTGSLILAGKGALKAGSGLVTYLMPWSIHETVRSQALEAMTCRLPEMEDGSLGLNAAEPILQQTGNKILVMGMGLSRTDESMALVRRIVDDINCPLVLDADALIALGEMEGRKRKQYPLIITPHPGEMAKIMNCSIREVQENRLGIAKAAAAKFDAVVVLKGSKTVIADANGKILVNPTGNAGMATGGMGDVLSGIIGAFLGQGLAPVDAAAVGVYFHGLAGDYAASEKGEMGLNAGDIAEYLPYVLHDYEIKLKG